VSTEPKIEVQPNGPYVVKRGAPLRRKRPIVSAHGEPIGWSSDDAEPQDRVFALCRCGGSANKPFCDGTHARSGFDGTETAPPDSYRERAPGSTRGWASSCATTAASASTPASVGTA
jgi:CDGSH-type Zn-finger protein